jgi:hypothetical protein
MKNRNGKKAVAPEVVKQEEIPVEQQTVSTEPAVVAKPVTLSVDFKKAYEESNGKKELPKELKFHTDGQKEINLLSAFTDAFSTSLVNGGVTGVDQLPVVVSRMKVLNTFCILNEITPKFSVRVNKNENKTETTYGQVPQFADTFIVDGLNYRILGFLKYRVVRMENMVAVKIGINFLVMSTEMYDTQFVKGLLLNDVDVTVVG